MRSTPRPIRIPTTGSPPPDWLASTPPTMNIPAQTSATAMITASARRPGAEGLIRSVMVARGAGGTLSWTVRSVIAVSPCGLNFLWPS